MQRERTVTVKRTTELPTKTFHLTKHHFTPIRYEPGVEVIRRPTVEHKTITSGNILTGQPSSFSSSSSSMHSGPRKKETIYINRQPSTKYADIGWHGPPKKDKIVKVVGGGIIGDPYQVGGGGGSTVTQHISSSSSSGAPQNFVNMQSSMENELSRRKRDWEGEVEKMQHNFFDMKTSDASERKREESGLKPTGILTVGDSHNLFHELPDGSRVFRQKFDLYGFDTDDLSVRVDEGKLTITASREDDYEGAKSTKQFNRTVDIPEGIDEDQISPILGEDGILTVEAPVIESKMRDEDATISRHTRTITESSASSPAYNRTVIESSEPGFSSMRTSSSPGYKRTVIQSSEPSFSSMQTRLGDASFPPEFNEVVETTTSKSSSSQNSVSPQSNFSRSRYLGPDVEETSGGRKLKTSLYIGRKYKADDIHVKLYDHKINVDAKSEEMIAGRTSKRQFARDVDIPGTVERDTFRAVLGSDGRLYLGGSFVGNDNHHAVTESIDNDMPSGGKSVNIMF